MPKETVTTGESMNILWGFLNIVFGVFFIWVGSFQIITSMLPHDFAMKVSEVHGAWMRENIFRLPPISELQNEQRHTQGD